MREREGFAWLTMVVDYSQDGYAYENALFLWTCDVCGAVVGDMAADFHREFHARA